VALKYQPESDNAPKVIAKGRGKVAEKLLKLQKRTMFLFMMTLTLLRLYRN